MQDKRILLVKILPERYRESFLSGDLYLNTPAYFKKLESGDIVRSDPDEGLSESRQFIELAVRADDGCWLPIEGIKGPLRFRGADSDGFNMLCLYTFTENSTEAFDERNLNFGNSFVVINNLVEFVRRFREAAALLKRRCGLGLVEYVDPAVHDGPMGPFRKYRSFTYQNEFRVIVGDSDGSALKLGLGNLRDICSWGDSADLNKIFNNATK
jgi:hypothetical protein